MFGLGFILIGILVLLRAYGFLSTVSEPVFWGGAFILVGILIMVRHSIRRQRRQDWIAERRAKKVEATSSTSDLGKDK